MHKSVHVSTHKRSGDLGPTGIKCPCCRKGTLKEARIRANRKDRRTARQSMHSLALTEGLAFIEAMEDAEIAYHHGNTALTAEDVAAHATTIETRPHKAGPCYPYFGLTTKIIVSEDGENGAVLEIV